MREFLRHFLRRRNNPVYRLHSKQSRILSLRPAALAYTALWTLPVLPFFFLDWGWSFFPSVYVVLLLILAPLAFFLFLPRNLNAAYLQELSLTQLTREQIAIGIVLPPLLKSLHPLVLFLAVIGLNSKSFTGGGGEFGFFLIFGGMVLSLYLVLLMGVLRFFSSRIGRTALPMIQSIAYGIALYPLTPLYLAFGTSGLSTILKLWGIYETAMVFGAGVLAIVSCQTTLTTLTGRIFDCLPNGEMRRATWFGAESCRDKKQIREETMALLSVFRTPGAVAAPFVLLLAPHVVARFIHTAASYPSKHELWSVILFSHGFIIGAVITMTAGYMYSLFRRGDGKLPTCGSAWRTMLSYSFLPACVAVLYSVATIPLDYLMKGVWEELVPRTVAVLFAAPLAMTVVVTMLAARSLPKGAVAWFVIAGTCFFAVREYISYARDGGWHGGFPNFIEMNPNSVLHTAPLFVTSYVMYMLIIGFTRHLQRLHDRRIIIPHRNNTHDE